MISTTGASPPQITESASSLFCASPTNPMVSSHSPGGHDADPKIGFINGDSPQSTTRTDSRLPPPASLCHMIATVAPKPVSSVEVESKSQNIMAQGESEEECKAEDLRRSYQSRNKRKNFKPRNIVYHYSEVDSGSDGEEYNVEDKSSVPSYRKSLTVDSYCDHSLEAGENNIDDNSDVTQPLDLSSENSSLRSRVNIWSPKPDHVLRYSSSDPVNLSLRRNDSEKLHNDDEPSLQVMEESGVSSSNQLLKRTNEHENSPSMEDRKSMERDSPLETRNKMKSLNIRSPATDLHHSIVARTSMSDYAENAVKELLGMYGLNENINLSPGHLPASNSDALSSSHSSCAVAGSDYQQSDSNLQLHQDQGASFTNQGKYGSPNLSKEPFNHYPDSQYPCDPESDNIHPLPEKSEEVIKALRAKMSHSMMRTDQLTPNNALPAHQIMLPQNMATIFTIAALGSKVSSSQSVSENVSSFSTVNNTSTESNISSDSSAATPCTSSAVSPALSNRNLSSPYRFDQHQKLTPVDYTRYVKRFSSAAECGNNYCKDLNYREHFHCMDCNSRVFVKKEEMIRHFKWHKKRDDSLQHGFMRYSPMDDCSDRFYNCSHNRKQTHYHCLKESCDKVYISTSDVQMHANYHRKDSAIIQEGFQRFRATENCSTSSCLFFGQRTTHFHCRRSGCSFTFKNKADMEKHKSYHIKDEQLNKDGFKKFMKHEHCSFENCRFSRVCNHIHCIRPGCTYVLHSSGQLYSHKRKHERRDTELAYRKFKLAQSMIKTLSEAGSLPQGFLPERPSSGDSSSSPASGPLQMNPLSFSSVHGNNFSREESSLNDCYALDVEKIDQHWNSQNISEVKNSIFSSYTSSTILPTSCSREADSTPEDMTAVDLSMEQHKNSDNLWQTYLVRYSASELCQPQCEYIYKEHFHCNTDNCSMTFRAKDIVGVKEHACNHEYQEQVTKSFYTVVEINQIHSCHQECRFKAKEKHYHCKWEKCQEVISSDDNPFRRLDHYKIHKYSRKLSASIEHTPGSSTPVMETMFRRKRGRPPKNRIIEYAAGPQFPQAMYTSFKLPKLGEITHHGIPTSFDSFSSVYSAMTFYPPAADMISTPSSMSQLIPVTGLGSAMFPANNLFQISGQSEKTENSSTDPQSPLSLHEVQSQSSQLQLVKPEVHEGFYVYSKNSQCPDKLCSFHGENHFHCMQPRCFYVTDRSDILLLHSKDFHDNIDILDGFVFYDRSVDCRLPGCHSNKINRHFHCVRSNCNYSFVRYSTMTIHDQKHKEQENLSSAVKKKTSVIINEEKNIESMNSFLKIAPSIDSTPPKTTVVKATGTFYPLSAFSTTQSTSCSITNSYVSSGSLPSELLSVNVQEKKYKNSDERVEVTSLTSPGIDLPINQSLSQHSLPLNNIQSNEKYVMYNHQLSCNQPFCRLIKKDHFHCNFCNQAVVGLSNLQSHVLKHVGASSPVAIYPPGHIKLPSPLSSIEDECGDASDTDEHIQVPFQNNMQCEGVCDHDSVKQDDHQMLPSQLLPWQCKSSSPLRSVIKSNVSDNNVNSTSHLSGNSTFFGASQVECPLIDSTDDPARPELKRHFTKGFEESNEIKKMKIAALRILKDEPIPEGYIRCRFNEDCGYSHCGYREHQTHFHCLRKDCGYSFCDKTRFVQHTARHERLDTLMGGDFQQYRANVNCGREECMYANTMGAMANKSSHFHCLKCDFVCTDTNKVVAHRRQHAKMDNIYAAGFEKYTPSQSCNVEGCNHNQKQTHYHCLKCQYSVLGLSQMSSHKYRHMEC